MTEVNTIIKNYFSDLAQRHHLKIHFLNDGEAFLLGGDFGLLVACDREGVKVEYVDMADCKRPLRSVDLSLYILTVKKWHPDSGKTDDYLSRIRQGISSWKSTLEQEATDILSGKRDWLSKAQHISPLSNITQEKILKIKLGEMEQ